MATKVFVNLPVKDLAKSMEFFGKLGFTFNPQFTNDKGTCMIIGEDIFIMLIVEEFFKTFTKKEIADTAKFTEAIIALSADNKQAVSEMVNTALKAGGIRSFEPQDHGFMYQESFQDLDGHLWEVFYMDLNQVPSNS